MMGHRPAVPRNFGRPVVPELWHRGALSAKMTFRPRQMPRWQNAALAAALRDCRHGPFYFHILWAKFLAANIPGNRPLRLSNRLRPGQVQG